MRIMLLAACNDATLTDPGYVSEDNPSGCLLSPNGPFALSAPTRRPPKPLLVTPQDCSSMFRAWPPRVWLHICCDWLPIQTELWQSFALRRGCSYVLSASNGACNGSKCRRPSMEQA